MSDERAHEFGDLDFGGVVVEEEEQFVVENEKIRRVEFVKEKESGSAENERETMLISSKSKRVKDISIDRLSALPDALLIHILSLVGYDVKEAAVTCVLSKRWQFLWSELPRLNFLDRTWDIEKVRDFVSWVHRTLLFRTGTYLEQFEVNFLYEECYARDVNAWIRFAVKSKVKDLSLELHSPMYFYKLPQVLYFNSCLTSLHIQRCILAPQRIIEWQSLTGLNIKDVELDERVIQKILSGCPVLHWLTLSSCWGFKRLDVNSESVYQLRVADFEERNSEPLLEISAPYLRSLHTLFCPTGKKLQLTNVASLVSFSIHFTVLDDSVEVMSNTMELLQKTQHVKEIRLEGAFVEWCKQYTRLSTSGMECKLLEETWAE